MHAHSDLQNKLVCSLHQILFLGRTDTTLRELLKLQIELMCCLASLL